MAESVAVRIVQEIQDRGLGAGSGLGSEAELVERIGASRWTVREAIGILQQQGLLEVRRGRFGGIFVTRPDLRALSYPIRTYFEFLDVGVDEIIEARRVLNDLAIRLAVKRLTADDVDQLRVPAHRHTSLLRAAHSPAVHLFTRSARRYEILAIVQSSFDEREYLRLLAKIEVLRNEQIEAVISGRLREGLDLEEAIQDVSSEIMNGVSSVARIMSRDVFVERLNYFLRRRGPVKKPQLLRYELSFEISRQGWPVGAHMGSERELLEKHRVGRWVFREAIRQMEQQSIVTMLAGSRSGLKVASPDVEQVIAGTIARLRRFEASRESYRETFDALATAAAGLATRRIGRDDDGAVILQELAPLPSEAFFAAIGRLSENRVIALMIRIIYAQLESYGAVPVAGAVDRHSQSARTGLIAAMLAGDEPRTRRNMILLLDAGVTSVEADNY